MLHFIHFISGNFTNWFINSYTWIHKNITYYLHDYYIYIKSSRKKLIIKLTKLKHFLRLMLFYRYYHWLTSIIVILNKIKCIFVSKHIGQVYANSFYRQLLSLSSSSHLLSMCWLEMCSKWHFISTFILHYNCFGSTFTLFTLDQHLNHLVEVASPKTTFITPWCDQ